MVEEDSFYLISPRGHEQATSDGETKEKFVPKTAKKLIFNSPERERGKFVELLLECFARSPGTRHRPFSSSQSRIIGFSENIAISISKLT